MIWTSGKLIYIIITGNWKGEKAVSVTEPMMNAEFKIGCQHLKESEISYFVSIAYKLIYTADVKRQGGTYTVI